MEWMKLETHRLAFEKDRNFSYDIPWPFHDFSKSSMALFQVS